MSCHVVRNPKQPDPAAQDAFMGPPQPDWVALGLPDGRAGEDWDAWYEDPRRCSCATPDYSNHTEATCYAVATQEDGLCDVCRIWNQTTNKMHMFDRDPYLKARRWEGPTESSRSSKGRALGTSYGELYVQKVYGSEENDGGGYRRRPWTTS